MNRITRLLIITVVTATTVIGVGAATAGATTAGVTTTLAPTTMHGTGTYAVTGVTVHSTQQIGPYTVVMQTLQIDNAGVLSGPSTADVTCSFDATGAGACGGVEHFTGTVDGRSGTATFAVGLTVDATGFHGSLVVVDGDGGLEGLRGTGTFEGGATGVNALDYRFVGPAA